ncbi:hypothetical protein [Sporisorium scitamineum]|uniref:Uncharacterized protein n=1 Tax=Sporisorium scitamineum TaxID=49012 RepID=A0A0F7SBV4_9BASI|nr:hypothetical protein [Sporisorium scitamineum]
MRTFMHFTISATWMLVLSATGVWQLPHSQRSSTPATVVPFTGRYSFQLRTIPAQRDEYAERLRSHIANVFRIPQVSVSNSHTPINEANLQENLNYDRNLRRFLLEQMEVTFGLY